MSKKILFIEDDAFLSSLVIEKLVEVGFMVESTMSGADGLAKAQTESPDLIILDVMLPDMGGFEILQELQSNEQTASIPVIILSNLGNKEEIENGIKLGATSYLIKSNILPHEVVEVVQKFTGDET